MATIKKETSNTFLDTFFKVIDVIRKYGLQNIFVALLLTTILGFMCYFVTNPEMVIENYEKAVSERISQDYEKRMKTDPQVREQMLLLKSSVYADRVFIFETHNGGSNLNGLKFIYMDMTYDESSAEYEKVEKEYVNLRTSSNPWIGEICRKGVWFGSIEEIKDIDLAMYYRMKQKNVSHVGLVVMYGTDIPVGCLGICYYDDNPLKAQRCEDKKEIVIRLLQKYGLAVDALLYNKR